MDETRMAQIEAYLRIIAPEAQDSVDKMLADCVEEIKQLWKVKDAIKRLTEKYLNDRERNRGLLGAYGTRRARFKR